MAVTQQQVDLASVLGRTLVDYHNADASRGEVGAGAPVKGLKVGGMELGTVEILVIIAGVFAVGYLLLRRR